MFLELSWEKGKGRETSDRRGGWRGRADPRNAHTHMQPEQTRLHVDGLAWAS